MADKRCILGGIIIQKVSPWTTVDNVFGECRAHCPLKTSFVDFEKDRVVVVATEYYIFRIFLVAVNSRYTIVPFSPRFGIKFRY